MAQLAIDKGVKVSRDGTLYSECLAHVRSQPKVWQAVKHAQKSLPHDVFESIQAMFSGAGEKEDVFKSVEAMHVFAGTSFEREGADSSKSVEPMPVFSGANRVVIDSREGTDSANVITLASGTIREGADTGSSDTSQKEVPLLAIPSNSSQSSGGADAERLKLSNLDWGSNDDDGLHGWAAIDIASDPLRQWS